MFCARGGIIGRLKMLLLQLVHVRDTRSLKSRNDNGASLPSWVTIVKCRGEGRGRITGGDGGGWKARNRLARAHNDVHRLERDPVWTARGREAERRDEAGERASPWTLDDQQGVVS